jgi:hypothetical protein
METMQTMAKDDSADGGGLKADGADDDGADGGADVCDSSPDCI